MAVPFASGTVEVNTGAAPQLVSAGPNNLNCTVPVRATFGGPVTVAVSVTDDPRPTVDDATWVVIDGWTRPTVIVAILRAVPFTVPPPVAVAVPITMADRTVWIPAVAGWASVVGTRKTLKVKLMVQVPPMGSTRAAGGVKAYRPVPSAATVNVAPAQPEPAAPEAVEDRVKTPGSGAVQARLKSAQEGW